MYVSAIGQDSHRFEPEQSKKKLMLGGVPIPDAPGLQGNSDADVLLHAICNALSGLSGINILGATTDTLCKEYGITDSSVYLHEALKTLGTIRLVHVSISVEGRRPHLAKHIEAIRANIATLCGLEVRHVCITATSGEGLTEFGKGEGIQALVIASACMEDCN